jgi:hypothetical protein
MRAAGRMPRMRSLTRDLVIGAVGLLIAGGLSAIALLGRDSGTSVSAMLAAVLIASAVGVFLFVEAWVWSQRVYRTGSTGRSIAIALAGGLMILLTAGALAASVILVLLFYAA